jgi:hypothetical protein
VKNALLYLFGKSQSVSLRHYKQKMKQFLEDMFRLEIEETSRSRRFSGKKCPALFFRKKPVCFFTTLQTENEIIS